MSTPFLAEIRMFAGNFAPRGWALTNGQILPISQNAALFSLMGTTYGGNGTSNFALPDLRGRLPLAAGSGAGLTPRFLGEMDGVEAVTLTMNQIPVHSHTAAASTNDADQPSPGGNVWAKEPVGATNPYVGAAPNAAMANLLGTAGGGQAHTNLMPFLTVTFIVAMQGIFPARN